MSAQRSGPARRTTRTAAQDGHKAAGRSGVGPAAAGLPSQGAAIVAGWAPTLARILLGLVLGWFGYHELVQPGLWTGYVPLVSARSSGATLLVLAHGWVLLMLAVALLAGILLRAAAAVAAILVLQIVITLTATGGLTDLTMRDVGVLGLALALTGHTQQRLTLTR